MKTHVINISVVKNILFATIISAFLFSCSNKETDPKPASPSPSSTVPGVTMATVEIQIEAMWGDQPLSFDAPLTLPGGDILYINNFKFFTSNYGFAQADSKEQKPVPYPGDSATAGIYLSEFTASNGNKSTIMMQAPTRSYVDLRFDVSVPREYNLADITTNPYPVNKNRGMYWSWNSGFKFLVINGRTASGAPVHLSIGVDSRTMSYNFRGLLTGSALPRIIVEKDKKTVIKLTYDVRRLFVNTDGSNYRLLAPTTPNTPTPLQVHGGYYSDVLKANAASAIEMISYETL